MTQPEDNTEARIAALRDVVAWRRQPISSAIERLREFPWDSDELVIMTQDDAIACLDLYLSGSVTAADVNLWADALEGRDDLGFDNDVVSDFIFDLANPDLTEPLSTDLAQRWRSRLRNPPTTTS